MSNEENLNDKFLKYLKIYLDSKNFNEELEFRFGTNYYNKINRIKFDNIIQKLKSLGFNLIDNNGSYHLNIQNEFNDVNTGRTKLSNIRTQIKGLSNIQKYCKINSFNLEQPENHISFLRKNYIEYNSGKLAPIDFKQFQVRLNYKKESIMDKGDSVIRLMLTNWKDSKKSFRFIKRFTFVHNKYPFKFDLSILKTSKYNTKTKKYITEYNINNSNLFKNLETYEVEMELLNNKARQMNLNALNSTIKKGIKMILSALQNSNYPISYFEASDILYEYTILTNKHKIKSKNDLKDNKLFYKNSIGNNIRKNRRNFIGPSSITIQRENIVKTDKNSSENLVNINNPYTVTDKADGERKLMYISKTGKIYLMDINMNVEFTGCVTKNAICFNSIIDGEHIYHDKKGNFINLYMCFDIYFNNGKNMRDFPFLKMDDLKYEDESIEKDKFRLVELTKLLKNLSLKSVIKDKIPALTVKPKKFYDNLNVDIRKSCKKILEGMNDGTMFDYETDGLIFTPIDKSVGSEAIGDKVYKKTWIYSLKWKPPKFNTIDFLVTTKKNQLGNDIVKNFYQDGTDLNSDLNVLNYKTIELRVGFDQNKHGFLNPFNNVIEDDIPKLHRSYNNNDYKPVPFYPTEPTPNYDIHNCNILLDNLGSGDKMYIEDKTDTFEDGMIVEFRFELNNDNYWQWIPIRVRYDKTADYKKGNKNYGNAYHVALGVWKSIHNPITSEMITTINDNIDVENDEVYYKKTNLKTITNPLRDFHNKYIKHLLINTVSNTKNTLLDMSVGKGGDLWKWYEAKLGFVLGLDLSKMNIEDRKDGACARYIKFRQKYKYAPKALFLHANSSLNYLKGDAFYDEKSKTIFNAVMGEGEKNKEKLGKAVYKQYGTGKEGFDIVSNMFSLHYFFEDFKILNNFVRNLSEMCKLGGYTIGTCYDGKRVFNMLRNKNKGESEFILSDERKMWEVTKLYSQNTFPDTLLSLGYKINVYQESINKTFPEYLVNFDYFTEIMEMYGFVLLNKDELDEFNLKSSIGSFESLFYDMNDKLEKNIIHQNEIGNANKLSPDEQKISFLNNYYIFKKKRSVNTEAVYKSMISKFEEIEQNNNDIKTKFVKKPYIKKYKRKVKLI